MRSRALMLVFLSVLLFVMASVSMASISLVDMAGRRVVLQGVAKKVLALSCSLREVVYLLQGESLSRVVGLEAREKMLKRQEGKYPCGTDLPYMMAYPSFSKLPAVRKGGALNLEEIVKLSPDVVFVAFITAGDAEKLQEKLKIPVVVVYAGPIGTIKQRRMYFRSLSIMGKVLGREKRAVAVVDYINSNIASLNKLTRNVSKKESVYIAGRAYYGSHGLLGTDPHWPPFEWVNARNVASGISKFGKGVGVGKEALMKWNPHYIFVSESSISSVLSQIKDPIYAELYAVKHKQIYGVLPYCWFAYNKGTALADAYYVGKILYPDIFSSVEPIKKADDIYKFLLGRPLYNRMKAIFGGFKRIELR
ncbi:MAG: ABC transporter substrate-binding protein [Synergistetes bacterium]|nr:ABC transporter substrate-binding protein [Synergistota bacterium]